MAVRDIKTQPQIKTDISYINRYQLEKYNGRNKGTCPQCRHKGEFTYFVDVVTGERVGDDIGICNRFNKCGYKKFPTAENLKNNDTPLIVSSSEALPKYSVDDSSVSTIDSAIFNKHTLEVNDNLTEFLLKHFDNEVVHKILKRYRVGQTVRWVTIGVATVFWQIDKDFDVRTGKIMQYDENGKRVKIPYSLLDWVHSGFNTTSKDYPDYNLHQCFFGEHLLELSDTFHVVESEKTAIICSIAKPSTYWLATGSLMNIGWSRMTPFKDKKLIFYPDKGVGFELWKTRLQEFIEAGFDIEISDVLEKTNIEEGSDLADLILLKINKNE